MNLTGNTVFRDIFEYFSDVALPGEIKLFKILRIKLPEFAHGASFHFSRGAKFPEAEKEASMRRAYLPRRKIGARGLLRRGINILKAPSLNGRAPLAIFQARA
jgi:hypothetical protein